MVAEEGNRHSEGKAAEEKNEDSLPAASDVSNDTASGKQTADDKEDAEQKAIRRRERRRLSKRERKAQQVWVSRLAFLLTFLEPRSTLPSSFLSSIHPALSLHFAPYSSNAA